IFDCQCQREDCDAEIPDPAKVVRSVSTEVVIHVVTDAATLAGAPGIGWVDGAGVISDDHVRDLAERSDSTITPVTPVRTPPARIVVEDVPSKDVVIVYPGAQAADPYRPTTACADFVRVRDGYCTEPGCGC
ncbi:HNH endonuclease, partial [Gordonia alkanivorans]|nr:HNH endonuclease [Gordonia alkanivorans]MDJ0496143.1 HNH endonuclease [Gordonia alkanivorans]